MAPSAEPAPTIVCSSSIKRITFFERTNLIHHGLDSLFELATIFCPGYQEREIERDDAFIAQQFRHLASRDFLSQALNDGGLSNPCFTEQHRWYFLLSHKAQILASWDHQRKRASVTEPSTTGTTAQFKAGIFVIEKLKPTVVIPTEVRLIFSETESIECAFIFFAYDPNGYEI